MDLDGLAVTFLDTAGLRDTDDFVEALGIERALQRAKASDLRVFLRDLDGAVPNLVPEPDDLVVFGKGDLRAGVGDSISGVTGIGIDVLLRKISMILTDRISADGILVRERHRLAVQAAISALELVRIEVMRRELQPELVAAELRVALVSMESLVGRVDVESLLGEIFASFCIGK
jgi:tRNA modification GTPase